MCKTLKDNDYLDLAKATSLLHRSRNLAAHPAVEDRLRVALQVCKGVQKLMHVMASAPSCAPVDNNIEVEDDAPLFMDHKNHEGLPTADCSPLHEHDEARILEALQQFRNEVRNTFDKG